MEIEKFEETNKSTKKPYCIFNLDDPLDPNLVKALIATESGFRIDPKTNKIARGIMQVRNTTRKYLADIKGELKN